MNDPLPETRRLTDAAPGEPVTVQRLSHTGSIRRRLFDVGLTPGTRVERVGTSPMGDPAAYLIRGAVIAIRAADARGVYVATGVRA